MPVRNAARQMLSSAEPAVIVKLAHHEAQLEGFGQRLSNMETAVGSINTKLDTVISSLAHNEALPRWDVVKFLQIAGYSTALIGAFVTSIVWITNASFSSSIDKMGVQIDLVGKRSVDFHDDVKDRLDKTMTDWKDRQANLRDRIISIEKFLLQESTRKNGINPEMQRFIPSPDDWYMHKQRVPKDERNL